MKILMLGQQKRKMYILVPYLKRPWNMLKNTILDTWIILSAKYGFIDPKDIIPQNYDACFHKRNSKTISLEELKVQMEKKNFDEYDRIIVLGGKYYTQMIIDLFHDKEVLNPLNGCKGNRFHVKKD